MPFPIYIVEFLRIIIKMLEQLVFVFNPLYENSIHGDTINTPWLVVDLWVFF